MKKAICIILVAICMLIPFSSFAAVKALSADWSGNGSYTTYKSISKPDSTSTTRYKWNSPIKVRLDSLSAGSSVTIKPVNANNVSMGYSITYSSTMTTFSDMPLSNVNYMHIHLKITANSGVHTEGVWKGTYYAV
jgi:hypothetical protein